MRLFVDTMVLAYATGGEHALRAPCRGLVSLAAAGDVELHASVEAIQEFLFHRLRRTSREEAVQQALLVRDLLVLHPCDEAVVDQMLDLVASTGIDGRDAVHAATATVAGFESIVSTDAAYDSVLGLERVHPDRVRDPRRRK